MARRVLKTDKFTLCGYCYLQSVFEEFINKN